METASDEVRAYYELNRRVYGWFAPWYDPLVAPLTRFRRAVVELAVLPRTARVLDAATGTGAQARAFAGAVREVVGIDISDAMLRVARRRNTLPNLSFDRADVTQLPFAGGQFDGACISFAMHEMPESIRLLALRELHRVLKPGGTLLIVDYSLPANALARWISFHLVKLYERDHYPAFVQWDLPAALRSAGFAPQREVSALAGNVRVVACLR